MFTAHPTLIFLGTLIFFLIVIIGCVCEEWSSVKAIPIAEWAIFFFLFSANEVFIYALFKILRLNYTICF